MVIYNAQECIFRRFKMSNYASSATMRELPVTKFINGHIMHPTDTRNVTEIARLAWKKLNHHGYFYIAI